MRTPSPERGGTTGWAVVGTGQISRSIVPDMIRAGYEIRAVYSRDETKARAFSAEFDIPDWTTSFNDLLLDPDVRSVYIATPIATHVELTARAIRAGKHVLVEKPIATSAQDADALFALAAEHGVFLMEAMWMKFNPAFRQLLDEIDADRLGGPPTHVRAGFAIPFPEDGNASRWDMSRSGGALLDQGIYPVTLALSVLGKPTSITTSGRVRADGLDLAEQVTLGFENGRFAQLFSAMDTFGDCSAAVGGPAGWATLTAPFWATTDVTLHVDDFRTMFRAPIVVTHERQGNGYVPMLLAVVVALDGGRIEEETHGRTDTVAVFEVLDVIRAQLDALIPS